MKIDKTDIKIILGIVAVGLLFRFLIKPKKRSGENKSSFLGNPLGKRVMFTLTNKTDKPQVVPLFNAYSNIQNPDVSITPSIAEFNRTLSGEPKKVTMIEVRAINNQTQAQQVIQINCKDASGEFKSTNLYPLVSVYQKALDMTSVQPNNFNLTGECYMNYTVLPKQTVIITVSYDVISTPKTEFNNPRGSKPNERTTTGKGIDKVLDNVEEKTVKSKKVQSVKSITPPVKNKVNWKKRALIGVGVVGGAVIVSNIIKSNN